MVEEKEDSEEELFDEDDAEYSRKSEYSKASVIQTQVQKCNELRSKEMSEGHTMRIVDNKGNIKVTDIPDGRLPYIGAVIALKCNLEPEINRSEEVKPKIDLLEKKKKELYEKYKYKEVVVSRTQAGVELKYSGKDFMPKKGAVLISHLERNNRGINPAMIPGLWDTKINAYWDEMVLLYDEIFSLFNILIDRNEYFKEQSGW